MVRSNNVGYDRHITIFSPDGKLYQLEYALRAVKCSNLTGLAVKDDNAIAVVSQKKLSAQQGNQDVLLDQSSVTHLYHITDEVMALLIGFPGDCMSILYKSREIALEYQYKYGCNIPARVLCEKLADINQVYTQHAYMRLRACTGLIMAIDEENGPVIYKFDASGWFSGYKACSVGAKDQEGENALERILKQRETVTLKEKVKSDLEVDTESHHLTGGAETRVTVEAIKAMIAIDAYDQLNGAKSIEVAICTRDNPVFRQLSEQEIETYLTHIAESD
ncbi:proteasome subunit alpha type 6 protein, putative [Babesia bigemina]|uniref:Proteasome subunit alpha type n=1 Tax=Babesia bigemina TaxID=5866 RepID=A0A061DBE6_BABBI|nr:proteasome subunit alpha type 6 protein, putative [Babesia bigemina]CDR95065.1 proteasome subunit alpha type 6 protein, putative [Babesia bigemina]|eukprot:XP_012767251.1 proteasome subunit alpha type 6 protein, putative [Babesia bigemina]